MTTGIFYHPSFSQRSYLTQGSRLQDFPDAIDPLLHDPRFRLYEAPPIDEDAILKVHTPQLLEGVRRDPLCSTAWHSAGGVALATQLVAKGEIHNAFSFIGAGGHHAGRNFFGGFCCFNDVVIAITLCRDGSSLRRFAILDTDAHHGDGTRDLVAHDPDILHVCLCHSRYESKDGSKVDVPVRGSSPFSRLHPDPGEELDPDTDTLYVESARRAFVRRCQGFGPDLIFWYFGFDTHQGDYGSLGLTQKAYVAIVSMMLELAEKVCGGRLVVVLGGGSRSDIASRCIPPIIEMMGTYCSSSPGR